MICLKVCLKSTTLKFILVIMKFIKKNIYNVLYHHATCACCFFNLNSFLAKAPFFKEFELPEFECNHIQLRSPYLRYSKCT